jgi:capsular exopolysaccharide synthesis family protein
MSDQKSRHPYGSWIARIRNRSASGDPRPPLERADEAEDRREPMLRALAPSDRHVVAMDDRHSVSAEQYRVLAARLEGLWKQPDFQKIAVTSALPGEGKTVTSINVGYTLAKDFGRRVLLIDGDLKRPSLWRYMGSKPSAGLSDVLANQQSPEAVVRSLGHEQLAVIEAGLTPMNPTRVWKSNAMKQLLAHFEQHYDYLILDTPPVLTVVDATLIADVVDGVIVVVRSGATPKSALQKALGLLPRPKLVGTVLNGATVPRSDYYYHVRQPR